MTTMQIDSNQLAAITGQIRHLCDLRNASNALRQEFVKAASEREDSDPDKLRFNGSAVYYQGEVHAYEKAIQSLQEAADAQWERVSA